MAGTIKADTWINEDGTENFKCRAWVNFNGIGTLDIKGSGNISSVIDDGVGAYTVNFTTDMVDTGYSVSLTSQTPTALQYCLSLSGGLSVSSFSIAAYVGGALSDRGNICVLIIR